LYLALPIVGSTEVISITQVSCAHLFRHHLQSNRQRENKQFKVAISWIALSAWCPAKSSLRIHEGLKKLSTETALVWAQWTAFISFSVSSTIFLYSEHVMFFITATREFSCS
jgi:hypothetical protein